MAFEPPLRRWGGKTSGILRASDSRPGPRSQGFVSKCHPELMALLDLVVFRLSVWKGQPLPGMSLMNLRYRDERAVAKNRLLVGRTGVEGPGLRVSQRAIYGLCYVGLRCEGAVGVCELAAAADRRTACTLRPLLSQLSRWQAKPSTSRPFFFFLSSFLVFSRAFGCVGLPSRS